MAPFQHFIVLTKGKGTKLKKFEEAYLPKTLYKINGKKVSKKKFNSEYKKWSKNIL